MDHRSLAAVAFRVTGVLILVRVVTELPMVMTTAWQFTRDWSDFSDLSAIAIAAAGLLGIASTAAVIKMDPDGPYAADSSLRALFLPASWSGMLRSTIRFLGGLGILLGAGKLSRFINRLTRKPADQA